MEISELGEFGLISQLTSDIKLENESSIKGVGDDCAILAPAEGMRTLVTTDLLMEGVHFDLTYVPLYCLGYKAVMVNLSDVYAMGGTPRQITVSLAISRRFRVEDIAEIYRGMRMACAKHPVDIVGGDTTSSFTGLAISITAIGEARPEEIVCRDGAQDTDLICVSGNLGAAYMGLQLLERERAVYNQQLAEAKKSGNKDEMARLQDFQPDVSGREYLLERQLKPEARADIIATLRQAGIHPTSMMDISDGLSSELMHICTQSHVGCRVYEERIPLDYQTAAMAEELNMNVSTQRRGRLRTALHRPPGRQRDRKPVGGHQGDRLHHARGSGTQAHQPRRKRIRTQGAGLEPAEGITNLTTPTRRHLTVYIYI